MERSQSGGYIIPGLIASYRLRVMKVHSTNPLTPGKKQNRHFASSAFHYVGKNAVKKEETPRQLPENFDMNCFGCRCRLQRNPGPIGISWGLSSYRTGNFSFRSCIWNQQYR